MEGELDEPDCVSRLSVLISMANIVLAEDSPTHTALIRSLLEGDSHRVMCFGNGRDAYEGPEHMSKRAAGVERAAVAWVAPQPL